MSTTFEKGYALLIGVNEQKHSKYATPLAATKNDVEQLAEVLTDPEKCGYLPEKVTILTGKEATRGNIISALMEIAENIENEPTASAIIYFSGHGYRKSENKKYYLIPYDFHKRQPEETALEDHKFTELIKDIASQRLLLLLDCCHAGETSAALEGFASQAANVDVFAPGGKPVNDDEKQRNPPSGPKSPGDKGKKVISVLTSSTGNELSYIYEEEKLSIFTYHLIEALNGHGRKGLAEDKIINVLDVISYVQEKVPVTSEGKQHPEARYLGSGFPISLLKGGAGIPAGEEADAVPRPAGNIVDNSVTNNFGDHAKQNNLGGTFNAPVTFN